jgi:ATP adenylyltransferase/5',5'''-P-1,P-4-tetraphosphate phosphorylase II
LKDGVAALKGVKVRTIQCSGYDVQLQFNPKRIQSTGAHVDAKSIRERKCFLCVANLPREQQGILYNNEFLLLCNPAPIFDHHGTIIHIHHIPQAIEAQIAVVLHLVKDLSPSFTLFYNGPKCGASAPDHLHFQASPTGKIPIELESLDPHRIESIKTVRTVEFSTMKNYGRGVLMLDSDDEKELCAMFLRTVTGLRNMLTTTEEPPLNIIFSYAKNRWRIIVIPRKKHRPDVYFKEGEEKILISPASVDIGGLVITPVEKDFQRVDADMIQTIFAEVCYDREFIRRILDQI